MNSEWPYVDGIHSAEKEEHIRLKSHAVEFLLGLGFTTDEMEEEKVIPKPRDTSSRGVQTDVYARRGDREVFVECETQFSGSSRDLSGGGRVPGKSG